MSATLPLEPAIRNMLMKSAVPTVVSTLWKNGYKNTFMFRPRALNSNCNKFVGAALTVRTIAAREDVVSSIAGGSSPNLQAAAVDQLKAGDVLVVAMGGETRTAFMGDIMTTYMKGVGVSGVVLDGSVSDAAAIAQIELPVFCTGNAATPLTSHRMVVEVNGPVECDGVAVYCGDVVMGDANGIVVIPRHMAAEVARIASEREVLEEFVISKVREGAPLSGTYPPNEKTMAEFDKWRAG